MFSARDAKRLDGVHPELVTRLRRVFEAFPSAKGPGSSRLFVVEGVRTQARQWALWQIGRTQREGVWIVTGKTVTQCDGTHTISNHQVRDGWGWAVDVAWSGAASDLYTGPWLEFGRAAEREGLAWGGRFPKVDMPHVELRQATR